MIEKTFKFNILAFFLAFSAGLLYVYIAAPKPKIVIKYPTPYNASKIVYRSDNDLCYKYNADEVKCDANSIQQTII